MKPPLLSVKNLRVWFPKETSFFGKTLTWVKAVDDVCFDLHEGETLGLVGESGSGKSTTGYAILRALHPREGSVLFCPDGEHVYDLSKMEHNELRPLRREMQMIFQDPFSSLNPRMTVLQLVSEPLKVNGVGNKEERKQRVRQLIVEAGLKAEFLNRYPHAFSGGQRQRIVIARALALQPKLIVCDEPVSALDVSVQAQILNLMMALKEKYGLSYVFIAHDLEVVRHIADRVAVMYAGRLVEDGTKAQVFDNPLHPYTRALLASSPKPNPSHRAKRGILHGEVPDPSNLPSGCVFHPRCPEAKPICREVVPAQTNIDGRNVRCLLYESGRKLDTSNTTPAAPGDNGSPKA
ncbi:MAG: ATP-binding cassette domain-containing protein [Planctomycetes bacterium]|nr:ATP-binding cassette domain-containing protein [Planctomycetota bacterium]